MRPSPDFRRLALASGGLLTLDDARGTTVRVRRGQVWITQYGDLVDHVLDSGDNWAVERNGRTVLQAQDDALVELTGPGAAVAVAPRQHSRTTPFAAWLHRLATASIERRWAPYV